MELTDDQKKLAKSFRRKAKARAMLNPDKKKRANEDKRAYRKNAKKMKQAFGDRTITAVEDHNLDVLDIPMELLNAPVGNHGMGLFTVPQAPKASKHPRTMDRSRSPVHGKPAAGLSKSRKGPSPG